MLCWYRIFQASSKKSRFILNVKQLCSRAGRCTWKIVRPDDWNAFWCDHLDVLFQSSGTKLKFLQILHLEIKFWKEKIRFFAWSLDWVAFLGYLWIEWCVPWRSLEKTTRYVLDGTGMNSVFKPKVSGAWNLHSGMDAWSENAREETTRCRKSVLPPRRANMTMENHHVSIRDTSSNAWFLIPLSGFSFGGVTCGFSFWREFCHKTDCSNTRRCWKMRFSWVTKSECLPEMFGRNSRRLSGSGFLIYQCCIVIAL